MGHDILTAILISFALGAWAGYFKFLRRLGLEVLNFGMDPSRSTHDSFFSDLTLAVIFFTIAINYVFGFMGPIKNGNILIDADGISIYNFSAILAGFGVGYCFKDWEPKFITEYFEREREKYDQSDPKSRSFDFDPFWDQVEKAAGFNPEKQRAGPRQDKHQNRSFEPKPGTKPIRSTHLSTLGLNTNASIQDIKKAYKSMARQYHPDIITAQGGSDKQVQSAEDQMKRINVAYDWLTQ